MSVSNERRTLIRRVAASPLIAACAALLVVLALVAPAFAGEGPTKLSQPNVTPRGGTAATTITFTVVYRNREGSEPEHVSAVIDGVAHPMTSDGSTNWHDGVLYTWHTKLAPGTHEIDFTAADTRKFTDRVGAGSVTIEAPAPAPTPTPTPTPTPRPTPEPTPTPAPGGGSGSDPTPAPTPGPVDGSTGGPTGGSTGGGTGGGDGSQPGGDSTSPGGTGDRGTSEIIFPGRPGPDGTGGNGSGGGDSTSGGGTGSGGSGAAGHPGWVGWSPAVSGSTTDPAGSGSGGSTDTTNPPAGGDASGASGSGSGGAGTGRAGPGWGALTTALQTLGIDGPPALTALPMLIGTTGAMTMAFAFAIFGKKRRDEEPPAPDEVLGANAARGHAGVPGGEVAGVVRATTIPAPVDVELSMPRWRRPSLQAARKADPARMVAVNQPMTFDSGIVTAVEGRERRVIRYAVVRLLDAPDELRSVEIGQLDQGDEVQLIERSGAYWLVLCPNGQQGWLHKMTLGEVVSDAAPTFTRDVDDDVLTAFLAARARA
jgi:hypothetical protein